MTCTTPFGRSTSGCVMSAVTLPEVTYWPVALIVNESGSPAADVMSPFASDGEYTVEPLMSWGPARVSVRTRVQRRGAEPTWFWNSATSADWFDARPARLAVAAWIAVKLGAKSVNPRRPELRTSNSVAFAAAPVLWLTNGTETCASAPRTPESAKLSNGTVSASETGYPSTWSITFMVTFRNVVVFCTVASLLRAGWGVK